MQQNLMCYTKLYLYSILIGDNDLVIALFLGMKFTLDDVVVQNNVSFDDFSLLTYLPYIERDLDGISGILFFYFRFKKISHDLFLRCFCCSRVFS